MSIIDRRDELAYRKAMGETLSHEEELILDIVNQCLEELLPKPAPLPTDVKQALQDLRELHATLAADDRCPPPPETLVGALQDRIHSDAGRARPARSSKQKVNK